MGKGEVAGASNVSYGRVRSLATANSLAERACATASRSQFSR
jgi:hypothetical protein